MFDDGRLDDADVLQGSDERLRFLAGAGPRVRAEVESCAEQLESLTDQGRPRAVVAAGDGARLLRAVLESTCPVPFVAWPGPGLPGWTGALDTVVVLAQAHDDPDAASAVAEAIRRGSTLLLATTKDSPVAELATGPYTTLLSTQSDDNLAGAVVLLQAMSRLGLGPAVDGEEVAHALDEVASDCSPFVDSVTNPAKLLAMTLGDCTPLLWGGSVLAARAARRIAEAVREETGRAAFAGGVEQLVPVIERTPVKDVFADPFETGGEAARPSVLIVDDGSDAPAVVAARKRLVDSAERADVAVELLSRTRGSELARYAGALGLGTYVAYYMGIGLSGPKQPR